MPKHKCQHEWKAKRSGKWLPCTQMTYAEFGEGKLSKWLCKKHFRRHQERYMSGYYMNHEAYFFSNVYVIKVSAKKWNVLVPDGDFMVIDATFKTWSRAISYGTRKNKQLTNPVGLRALQLRTV